MKTVLEEGNQIADLSINAAYSMYCENMSSEEAQEELVEAFILYLVSVNKYQRVANADIRNSSGESIDGKAIITMQMKENKLCSVNDIIRNNPALLSEQQRKTLSEILGYSLFKEGEIIPISSQAIVDVGDFGPE